MDERLSQPEARNLRFILPQNVHCTPCGNNHTHHSETWPTSGDIVIEKCERQCRFEGCKRWSKTAAALRKHVKKHIEHNSLPLKVVTASSGRNPLKITVVQNLPIPLLETVENASREQFNSKQQANTMSVLSVSHGSPRPKHLAQVVARNGESGESGQQDTLPLSTREEPIPYPSFFSSAFTGILSGSDDDHLRVTVQSTVLDPFGFFRDDPSNEDRPTNDPIVDPWISYPARPVSPAQLRDGAMYGKSIQKRITTEVGL